MSPFISDGSGVQLPDDCDDAAAMIAEHNKTWVPPEKRPKPTAEPGIYRHFKGKDYEVLGTAQNADGEETFVVYRAVGETELWVRPLWIFAGVVRGDEKRFVLVTRTAS